MTYSKRGGLHFVKIGPIGFACWRSRRHKLTPAQLNAAIERTSVGIGVLMLAYMAITWPLFI